MPQQEMIVPRMQSQVAAQAQGATSPISLHTDAAAGASTVQKPMTYSAKVDIQGWNNAGPERKTVKDRVWLAWLRGHGLKSKHDHRDNDWYPEHWLPGAVADGTLPTTLWIDEKYRTPPPWAMGQVP